MNSRNMDPLQMSAGLFIWILGFSVSRSLAGKIIGGQEVSPNSIGYQASLHSRGGHYCGGTLVHSQWVVSAAHCWRPSSRMWVVLSEHNLDKQEGSEQIFSVSKIFVHKYNYWTYDNDIMLIKLSRPASLNAYVQPAVLPEGNLPDLTGRTTCTVSGWGVTHIYSSYLSPVLRAVDVRIIEYCKYYYYWMKVTSNMVCAGSRFGGKDSCQGDSGGPLVCNGYFEGIVSWGISCANRFYPGVYTKVRNYVPWIKRLITENTP